VSAATRGRERPSGGDRGREPRQPGLDLGELGPDGRLTVRRTGLGGVEILERGAGRVSQDAGIEVPS
jgi:hypothetical protein